MEVVSKLRNERGIMLPDLIASLPLGVIVLLVMTISILNFITAYSDIREYTKLQDDLFQAIETIRYGYIQRGVNTNGQSLCGLMSANRVNIESNNSALDLQVDTETAYGINSRIFINSSGVMKLRGSYGASTFSSNLSSSNDIPIFPDGSIIIDGEQKYRILNPNTAFSPTKTDVDGNIRLLGIDLEAQVRFRERENGQSSDDDIRLNTRSIHYETQVFIGNVPKSI